MIAFARNMVLILAFVSLIFLAFFVVMQRNGLGFSGAQFPWLQFVLTCFCMITGIFFGTLYRRLSAFDPNMEMRIHVGAEIKAVFQTVAFWRAVCVAPLVFMAIYTAANGIPGDLPSLLLAFQNGFFWENILKK